MNAKKFPFTVRELLNIVSYDRKSGRLFRDHKPVGVPGKSYGCIWIGDRNYRTHRLIYFIETGRQPDVIDHIDGDYANNRISNLRESTHSENIRKGRMRSDNSSGRTGVSFCNQRKKWKAYIWVDGRNIYVGQSDTKSEACVARRKAEDMHYGKFFPIDRPKSIIQEKRPTTRKKLRRASKMLRGH